MSGYLLDTNVVSETQKKNPNPHLVAWLRDAEQERLFISVLTIGEVRHGIERLRPRDQGRAQVLERWLSHLESRYADRIVPFDAAAAQTWGLLSATGPTKPIVDTQIAATALTRNLVVATRNTTDFEGTGVRTVNPFTGA